MNLKYNSSLISFYYYREISAKLILHIATGCDKSLIVS